MPLNREQEVLGTQIKTLLDLLPVIATLEKQLEEHHTNLGMMANTTFVCRKTEDILDLIKKKINALERKTAERASMLLMTVPEHKFSTEYCTISDNSEFYVQHPTKPDPEDPVKNQEFFDFIGRLYKEAPDVLRPDYKTLLQKIMDVIQSGGQIPFGLDKERIKGMIFKLRMRGKKEL